VNQVLIVHGWSDNSSSFKSLAEFLKQNGYDAITLWLGDYLSLDDDVRIQDVAKRMEEVIQDKLNAGELKKPFDIIVHSTGGLVAREWISAYYGNDTKKCPAKRLIMLAPANFGSRLAALGRSMLGRIFKGWNNWFETGTEMLNALELSSPFQWDLARRDLFVPEGQDNAPALYGAGKVWPFIITGSHVYTSTLREIVNEDGSDGTVRVPAANLNTRGVTIDFAQNEAEPGVYHWKTRHAETFPFAVLPDRTHASIITPDKSEVKSKSPYRERLGELILEALACNTDNQYQAMAGRWNDITEETARIAADQQLRDTIFSKDTNPEWFHQYSQVNVRVVDDHGAEVDDYFLEFFGPEEEKGNATSIYFHREVLEHVHLNKNNNALRCLYLDRTDLYENYYQMVPANLAKVLNMSISATPPGENVSYFGDFKRGAKGILPIHFEKQTKQQERWLKRNTTHFVKIIIPRTPKPDVFKLKKA
jgi:pimeloyl-ACP methyl ester carboxylesterase